MIRLLTLVLFAIGTGVSAQSLRVRSGEHDGYTRLVVQVPAGTEWALDQGPNGAQLRVAIDNVSFDTTSVFNRLSGGRLQSLGQSEPGAALDMTFGCECVATAFLHRQTMVVIDIGPGKPPPASDTPTPFASPSVEKKSAAETAFAEVPAAALALPLLDLDQRDFEQQLISRILQSADREVIDLHLAGVGRRHSTEFGPLRSSEQPISNLRVSSVLDDVSGLAHLAIPQIDDKPECITDSELAFDAWSGTGPFSMGVADLRIGLFQEFDRLDQALAMDLAKLYTYFGFGAEALQALSLQSDSTSEQSRLAIIASVMDNLPTPTPNPFEELQRCEGSAGLWALLSTGELDSDADVKAIERSFGRLPQHLRQNLGPDLAEILVSANHLEASRRVLRAVERVLEVKPADITLTKAKIADAQGDTDTAESLLGEVVSDSSAATEAPLALARLIEKRWSDRGAVSPKELDLIASYARELRKADLGPMMAQAHTLAMALSNDFAGAMDGLKAAPKSREWHRTGDQVHQLLAERADDITFLRHVFAMTDKQRNALTLGTVVAAAERLVDLGFPAQAYALSNRPQDRGQKFDRAQVRARAALLNGRPHKALLEIEEDASDSAHELRAQAMEKAGDFEAAAHALREIGETDAADRYSWLAGADNEESVGTNVFADLTRIRMSLTNPIERQPDKPLSDAATLLQDSAMAREQITEMLEKVQAHPTTQIPEG